MSIERLKDGRYRIRYFKSGSKRGPRVQEMLGHVTRKKAEEVHAQRILTGKREKLGRAAGLVTFRQLAADYSETHGPEMAVHSRERVEQVCRLYLVPFFGNMLADEIKPGDWKRYRNDRLTAKASAATINREYNVFRAILNYGVAGELIERNPIPRGAVRPLQTNTARLIYFEPEEWRRFVAAFDDVDAWRRHVAQMRNFGPVKIGEASDTPRRFGAGRRPDSESTAYYLERLRSIVPVFRALLYTGSRLGEIVGLRWEDVDLRRGVLTITQEKTKKAKTVPISKELRSVLGALQQGIARAHVFTRADGKPFAAVEVQRAFGVARKLSGVRKELTPHSLRHTFASWLAIAGTPLRTIQELLGHSSPVITAKHYAHLSPSHLAGAIDAIGEAERGGTVVAPSITNTHESA